MIWCAREDLNLHPLRDQILSLACLPFHHSRDSINGRNCRTSPCTYAGHEKLSELSRCVQGPVCKRCGASSLIYVEPCKSGRSNCCETNRASLSSAACPRPNQALLKTRNGLPRLIGASCWPRGTARNMPLRSPWSDCAEPIGHRCTPFCGVMAITQRTRRI